LGYLPRLGWIVRLHKILRTLGLNHRKAGEDDAGQFADVLPHKYVGHHLTIPIPTVQPVAVQRVAARALAFDLMYLLTRMEMGR
jgi:hypothetical protein